MPTLPLTLLTPVHRGRFTFELEQAGRDDGTIVEFKETSRPTYIATTGGRDLPVDGRFWMDEATGTILRTELHAVDTARRGAHHGHLPARRRAGMCVPVRMEERYRDRRDPERSARRGHLFAVPAVPGQHQRGDRPIVARQRPYDPIHEDSPAPDAGGAPAGVLDRARAAARVMPAPATWPPASATARSPCASWTRSGAPTTPAQHAEAHAGALRRPPRGARERSSPTCCSAEAAKKKGMSADAYVEAEIAKRVKPVTDAEVVTFYQSNINQMQGRSLEQMAPAINRYLADQQRDAAREALIAELQQGGAGDSRVARRAAA